LPRRSPSRPAGRGITGAMATAVMSALVLTPLMLLVASLFGLPRR
jgi:hypothetical protein